jgi:MFS family permease
MFWLSLYLYVPILPLQAERVGSSLSMVGLIIASYAIAQVALRIPIGVSADIVGRRKPFAVAAVALATVGAIGLAFAPNPWTLFAARAVTGIAAAGWVAISVLYASYFTPERSGHAMSRIMSINTISIVLASIAGGMISDRFGPEATFYGGAAAGVVSLLLLSGAREPALELREVYSGRLFIEVARTPLLLVAGGIGILTHFVTFAGSFGFVPVYADRIGASDAEVGYVMTAMLVAAVGGTLISTYVVARLGHRAAIMIGATIVAASMAIVPSVEAVGMLAASQAAGGFGRGLTNTVLFGLSLRAVAPAQRATAMGIFQAIYAIGMMSGPLVAGLVADASGLDTVFYMVAIVSIAAGVLGFARPVPGRRSTGNS